MSGFIRTILNIFFLAIITAGVTLAGTAGKIRGKLTDKSTQEGLISANVVIENTTLGATTDINGEYIILNVPPGTHVIRASLLGYRTVSIQNVKVTVDLTTEVHFQLESEAIPGPTVIITAEAPLVNKSATNTVAIVPAERIQQLPLRDVREIFALSGAVVRQGDDIYVRGGRAEETAFYVDGVLVNNPINGRLNLNIINNALEEVQSQIGGMTAQYGNAMSGIVSATTKVGGPKYNTAFEYITDQLGGETGKNIFGAYSYGLSEYVLTVGGPIIPDDNRFRFFFAGQRIFNRSRASFLDGIRFPVTIDSNDIQAADFVVVNRDSVGGVNSLPPGSTGNRSYLANLLNNSNYGGGREQGGVNRDSWALNGNLYFDFTNFNIKVGGTYNFVRSIGGRGKGFDIVRVTGGSSRGIKTEALDAVGYAKFTHVIDPSTFYSLQLNYYLFYQESGDQFSFSDVESYGDPNKNPSLIGPSRNPPQFSVWSFTANWPDFVARDYSKQLRGNIGGRLDFTRQFGKSWELLAGGEYTRYTIRSYSVEARSLYLIRKQTLGVSDWRVYNDANVSTIGYDIYGNEFDGGTFTDKTGYTLDLGNEGPRNPVFFGGYVQNKFEFEDLILNAGLRLDILDPGGKKFRDLQRIYLDDFQGGPVVADSSLEDQEVFKQVSPRVGLSFPVSDRTVFHATYGKFIQLGRLSDLYDSRMTAARFFAGGFARQFPNPNLKPERTTDYEVGFRQQVGDAASFDLTFFYKDVKDLHVIRVVFPNPGSETSAWFANVNGDYGTTKGLTLSFQLRRTNRISLNGNYTFSNSIATGSNSRSHFDIAWQDNSFNGQAYFPVIPASTEFDRTHTGNINFDYRFDRDDGPTLFDVKPLERVGANVLLSFSSGVRYTTSQIDGAFAFSSTNAPIAFENLNNSAGPWNYEVDLKIDKTFILPQNLDLNLYLWITNLFNRRNVNNGVYTGSGLPDNDGWFSTPQGKQWEATNGPDARKVYDYLVDNLGFYGPPRIVRLGVRLSL